MDLSSQLARELYRLREEDGLTISVAIIPEDPGVSAMLINPETCNGCITVGDPDPTKSIVANIKKALRNRKSKFNSIPRSSRSKQ